MRRTFSILPLASLLLLALTPMPAAHALQTEEEKKAKDEEKESKTEKQIKDLATAVESLRDKPADTVATGGGELEGALMSAFVIEAAARRIAADNAGAGPFFVIPAEDLINTDHWLVFDAQVLGLCFRLAQTSDCSATQVDMSEMGGSILTAATAVLPLLSSLLRSETEISNLGGGFTDSKLLARALAENSTTATVFRLYSPPRVTSIDVAAADPQVKSPYARLMAMIERRNVIAADNAKKKKPDAAVNATIKLVDEFVATILTADANGVIPLVEITRAKAIIDFVGTNKILAVKLEKAGGTMLKRKGIDVALGAPSIRASGGIIASYTVEESGGITKVGVITCTTRVTELKRVHQLKPADFASSCH